MNHLLEKLTHHASFKGMIPKDEVQKVIDQTGLSLDQVQLALLSVAEKFAKPVISNFPVGAVARGSSGHFYLGMNLEFKGLPLIYSIHAEQAAILNARFFGEKGIESIAASATPCGICRQFMNEMAFVDQLRILLPNETVVHCLPYYLPNSFGPANLNLKCHLMQMQTHQLHLEKDGFDDPVILAALEAANHSYAPYTKAYAGVSVKLNTGEIFTGSYVENVAFNPSFPPLGLPLIHLNFAKQDYQNIQEVVLVEAASSTVSQKELTKHLLQSIAPSAVFRCYKT